MGYYLLDNKDRSPAGVRKFYTTRRVPVRGVVIHTAENLPDFDGGDTGAERVSEYGVTTSRQVSWHATVDSDSIVRNLPDDHTAFHVRGYNSPTLGVEIATQAHRWGDGPAEWEEAVLRNLARLVKGWCDKHDLPIERVSTPEFDAGGRGLLSHAQLDPSRRSDPGIRFPWDDFLDLMTEGPVSPPASNENDSQNQKPKPAAKTSWEEELLVELRTHRRPSRHPFVYRIQHLLRLYRFFITVDGIFGPETERAVKEFQARENITVDGIVGPQTWGKLLTCDYKFPNR